MGVFKLCNEGISFNNKRYCKNFAKKSPKIKELTCKNNNKFKHFANIKNT